MDKENSQETIQPTDIDILFGKDDASIKHVGNVCLRTVIGLSLPEYKALPQDRRVLKNRFLKGLVERIIKSGRIFLKSLSAHSDKWNEVRSAETRMKVGQRFGKFVVPQFSPSRCQYSFRTFSGSHRLSYRPSRDLHDFCQPRSCQDCKGQKLRDLLNRTWKRPLCRSSARYGG